MSMAIDAELSDALLLPLPTALGPGAHDKGSWGCGEGDA